jgi:hypothetical protein
MQECFEMHSSESSARSTGKVIMATLIRLVLAIIVSVGAGFGYMANASTSGSCFEGGCGYPAVFQGIGLTIGLIPTIFLLLMMRYLMRSPKRTTREQATPE